MARVRWRTPKLRGWILVALFLIALFPRLIDLSAAGNTWDEHFYYNAARVYFRNWANKDFSRDSWRVNFEHPPVGKYFYFPAVAYNKWRYSDNVPANKAYDAPRVIAALSGALTTLLVFMIGKRLFGQKTAVIGALIYALLPPVIAYDRIISLDPPLVFFWTLSVFFLVRGMDEDKPRDFLWSGLAGALAFATKFNGLLIIFLLFGGYLLWRLREIRRTGRITIPLTFLAIPLLFPLVLFLVWPWLWPSAFNHFVETLTHWGGAVSEVWFGRVAEPPPSYFLFYFLVSVPLLALVAASLSLWWTWKTRSRERLLLLLWLLIPFLISLYHLRQDGIRYVLPAYPALALLAGDGVSLALNWVREINRRQWLVRLGLLYLTAHLFFIHPYYLSYFNEVVGLPLTVQRQGWFDLGFYGSGIREATEYVNQVASPGATVHFEIIPDDNPYLDRENKKLVRLDQTGADFLVVNTRARRERTIDLTGYKEIYAVKATGAPFVWVYQRER